MIEDIGYLRLSSSIIKRVDAPEILIAGCGTGQHSIETARRFKKSRVLAVDLSFASLSYAKRKTKELGFQNITYLQADILNLKNLILLKVLGFYTIPITLWLHGKLWLLV